MADNIIILGGGGHALSVADVVLRLGHKIVGCIAREASPAIRTLMPWLGKDLPPRDNQTPSLLVNGIGSAGPVSIRRRLYLAAIDSGYRFASLSDPSSHVSERQTRIGDGCLVLPGAAVNIGVRLGDNVLINTGVVVDHGCDIGSHSHIASGATLCGDCRIGESVHIGAGATVIQGIEIGFGAVIAAGAVVTENVEPLTLVSGVPARKQRDIDEQELA